MFAAIAKQNNSCCSPKKGQQNNVKILGVKYGEKQKRKGSIKLMSQFCNKINKNVG